MPVHERKRGAHDEPATNMQFSLRLVTLLQSHPASLTLRCVLLSVESNKTVTVTVGGPTDLAGSILMVGVDNRLGSALLCKGNVTVTSDPLGCKIHGDGNESCLCMFGDLRLRGRNMRCPGRTTATTIVIDVNGNTRAAAARPVRTLASSELVAGVFPFVVSTQFTGAFGLFSHFLAACVRAMTCIVDAFSFM